MRLLSERSDGLRESDCAPQPGLRGQIKDHPGWWPASASRLQLASSRSQPTGVAKTAVFETPGETSRGDRIEDRVLVDAVDLDPMPGGDIARMPKVVHAASPRG